MKMHDMSFYDTVSTPHNFHTNRYISAITETPRPLFPRVCRLLAALFALTLLAQNSEAQLEKTLAGHTRNVNSVAYSPGGAHIASSSDDDTHTDLERRNGRAYQNAHGA